jgi:hypothetical protein
MTVVWYKGAKVRGNRGQLLRKIFVACILHNIYRVSLSTADSNAIDDKTHCIGSQMRADYV